MNPSTELQVSFECLRETARDLDDIHAWFKDHLEVFPGVHHAINKESLQVWLALKSDALVYDLAKKPVIELQISIKAKVDDSISPVLESLNPHKAEGGLVGVSVPYDLEFPLIEWPAATATAVGYYFEHWYFTTPGELNDSILAVLDRCLAEHFPGFTMEKLLNLQRSELLPMNDEGNIDFDNVVNLLFSSRETTPAITPAFDYMP